MEINTIQQIKNDLNSLIGKYSTAHAYHNDLSEFIEKSYQILLSPNAKRIRGCIPVLVGNTLNLDVKTCLLYGLVIELLHFTSLIHDDVIDNHSERRGIATLNSDFTKRHGVLIGDYLMCEIVNFSLQFKNRATIIKMVIEAAKDLVAGLIIEQDRMPIQPDLHSYEKMVAHKTCSLFRLSFGLPFVNNDQLQDAIEVANNFGLLYQIYDDYYDRQEDKPYENIFGILSKSEIQSYIDDRYATMMTKCDAAGIKNVVEQLLDHLKTVGYFIPLV